MRIYDYFLMALMLGLVVGGCSVWMFTRARLGTETEWGDRFKAIASDTLRQSHESFLQLAEGRLKQTEVSASAHLDKKTTAIDEMLKPVKETLGKMDAQIQAMEKHREGAYKELLKAVGMSNETQQKLREDTGQLLQALRSPNTRGQWGEIQVRRILEMTGMSEHTSDFTSQQHIPGEEGAFLRPDYVVKMPGDRCVVIDSKVPLSAYLDGAQSDDSVFRAASMQKHAKQMREHIRALSSKAYWDQVDGAADFAVLFVPGDHFLAGALDCDPDLIEYSNSNNVVLATPMTLVALLRTVALSWRQENLRENAQKLGALGGELYNSIAVMTEHVSDVGRKLGGSLESYNKLVGSIERNVLPKTRRLREYGATKEGKDLTEAIEPIDLQARQPAVIHSIGKDDAA
ncbi:MAG: DNA recombination protein RmuC [Alphaproteobacteria bacterium]|nr:DNA recombination protein RmuC [Alphaproteobacteria bacterium]